MLAIPASSESIASPQRSEASGGTEGLAALLGGAPRKKGKTASSADNPFASILAKAGEALRTAQAAAIPAKQGGDHSVSEGAGLGRRPAAAKAAGSDAGGGAGSQAGRAASARAQASGKAVSRDAAPEQGTAKGFHGQVLAPASRKDAGNAARRAVSASVASAAGASASGAAGAAVSPSKAPRPAAIAGVGGDSRAEGADDPRGKAGGKTRASLLDLRRSRNGLIKEAEAGAQAQPMAAQAHAREEPSALRREVMRELGILAPGSGKPEAGAFAEKADAAPQAGSDFSSMLAQRLRETGNGEIVQAARIVLKDGDAGTIRLRLRPESLGEVKIELNLSDKRISGKIVVESEDAKSAFERNMAELSDAFRQGGFETSGLEVSVGSGSGRQGGGDGGSDVAPYFSERLRAVSAASEPVLAAGAYARGGNAVDLLV